MSIANLCAFLCQNTEHHFRKKRPSVLQRSFPTSKVLATGMIIIDMYSYLAPAVEWTIKNTKGGQVPGACPVSISRREIGLDRILRIRP